jgi:hypothetical protein
MLGSDVSGWAVQRSFTQTKWLRECVEAVTHALIQQDYGLAYHELMWPLGDEKIKQSVETSQLMASLERLIEKKQMHNSKITKIVPFTDEELNWLLSPTT